MVYTILFLLSVLTTHFCYGRLQEESSEIRIGQPIPEIVFEDVKNSTYRHFSTANIVKPTILYIFSMGCRASFSGFSEIDRLYSKYRNDFDLVVVGLDLDDGIRRAYRMYEERYDLNFPIAFSKSLYKKHHISGVPCAIWIKQDGVVQAVTNFIDESYLGRFLRGMEFEFISYDPEGKRRLRDFDSSKPFLVNGNGGKVNSFLFRSLFTEWRSGMPSYMPWAEPDRDPLEGLQFLQVLGRELADLYRIAYFGKTYAWHPGDPAYGNLHFSLILELQDKSKFEANYKLGKGLFCYSQVLPPELRNADQMRRVLQRDLKSYLGYDVVVETRQMPYLALTATEEARMTLGNSGKSGKSSHSTIGLTLIDSPVSDLIAIVSDYLNLTLKDLPLMDETRIQGNIDLSINAIMTDVEDVRSALRAQGLLIEQKSRPMKVIVIQDPTRH